MRQLATIRTIDSITPIEDADRIELAVIGGWCCVVNKGEFQSGDLCIYIEIDAWVPHVIAPFLTKEGFFPRVYNGVEGQRLKTKKLRGVYSQGLVLPITTLLDNLSYCEGQDVTDILGIQKWEAPEIDSNSMGHMNSAGLFPKYIPKTEQERIQNLTKIYSILMNDEYEVTEKLHGTSCTILLEDSSLVVCSRNFKLKECDNVYWNAIKNLDLKNRLEYLYTCAGNSYALQGEVIGPGINKNMYKLSSLQFRIFDIYNISEQKYELPEHRYMLMAKMDLDMNNHVPVLEKYHVSSIEELNSLIGKAEYKSTLNSKAWAEGHVYKSFCRQRSFKCISNKFLMKMED